MRHGLTIAIVLSAGGLLWLAPKLFGILFGVAVAAGLVRYAQDGGFEKRHSSETSEAPTNDEPPIPQPAPRLPGTNSAEAARVREALDLARRELDSDSQGDLAAILLETSAGSVEINVGYASSTACLSLRYRLGAEVELAFIIRRKHTTLGLAPLVDNTPISTARFEYRLRTIPLPGPLGAAFDAGTNRPRLFRELLETGLLEELEAVLYHPSYRLEDLVYGGDSLSVAIHPAGDPTQSPWLHSVLSYSAPLTQRIRHFLETVPVSPAQG